MADRMCCFVEPGTGASCALAAEWELWPSTVVYEFVDSCTAHIGALLDDAPYTRIYPIKS